MRRSRFSDGMSGVRLVCKACKFYMEERGSQRCTYEENVYDHWSGVAYMKHPSEKNLRGKCENYEEINS
jgi:hypothetical protein